MEASKDLFLRAVRMEQDRVEEGSYVFSLPMVRWLLERGGLEFHKRVTFLVGENGVGKSTLIEAIAAACGFNPEGGSRNFTFSTHATHSELYRCLRPVRGIRQMRDGFFLRAESFYNVASNIDDIERTPYCGGLLESYGGKSLHEQSHGESFLALVSNRFGGEGLYLLDEPEAALSPMRQLTLLALISDLVKAGSQFIVATHSPILMALPGAEILLLSEEGLAPTAYEDTEHYRVTRDFLNDPAHFLKYLL